MILIASERAVLSEAIDVIDKPSGKTSPPVMPLPEEIRSPLWNWMGICTM